MSIFGKLKFWGKDDTALNDISQPFPERDPLGMSSQPDPLQPKDDFMQFSQPAQNFQPQSFEQHREFQARQPSVASTDSQLIAAKLDVLKANIENLNQRLANIELMLARNEQTPRYPRYP